MVEWVRYRTTEPTIKASGPANAYCFTPCIFLRRTRGQKWRTYCSPFLGNASNWIGFTSICGVGPRPSLNGSVILCHLSPKSSYFQTTGRVNDRCPALYLVTLSLNALMLLILALIKAPHSKVRAVRKLSSPKSLLGTAVSRLASYASWGIT